jgi:predicted dithiol-disulfide oxidoreductase (DUF899 family)
LNQRDTIMIAVSRAPYSKLAAFQKRMDWDFKWLSSYNTDFNFDLNISFTQEELAKNKIFTTISQFPILQGLREIGNSQESLYFSRTTEDTCSIPTQLMLVASTC